ncbi:hypothetical protein Sjap_005129 [Stephania japonica]|uniref:Uncharacterized protein n=1 Tax=Stephania japonica TaxID=461633 RepID=A0AAP0PLJ7_9MAGN
MALGAAETPQGSYPQRHLLGVGQSASAPDAMGCAVGVLYYMVPSRRGADQLCPKRLWTAPWGFYNPRRLQGVGQKRTMPQSYVGCAEMVYPSRCPHGVGGLRDPSLSLVSRLVPLSKGLAWNDEGMTNLTLVRPTPLPSRRFGHPKFPVA